MKRILFAIFFVAVVFISGCATAQQTTSYQGKKLKTAFFIDKGSRGGGVINIARILYFSPQIDLTLIDGKDLRNDKLAGMDLIVMPGGSSADQMKSMNAEGVEILRNFIKNGGSYVGVCAGCHITLNRPERARIFPYRYDKTSIGAKADLPIEISEQGAKILDIPQGEYLVRYSHGPIVKKDSWDQGKCETLAVYKGSVNANFRRSNSFLDTPAMIYGNFGKGKVIATSFHPEYLKGAHPVFHGCVYAVTGVKITPQFPVKNYRPLRIAYYFAGAQTKNQRAMLEEIFALENCPELALQFGLSLDMCDNVDMIILADAGKSQWGKFSKSGLDAAVKDFMDKGGKVICIGTAWDKLPDHKNLIRLKRGDSVVKTALEIAKK